MWGLGVNGCGGPLQSGWPHTQVLITLWRHCKESAGGRGEAVPLKWHDSQESRDPEPQGCLPCERDRAMQGWVTLAVTQGLSSQDCTGPGTPHATALEPQPADGSLDVPAPALCPLVYAVGLSAHQAAR